MDGALNVADLIAKCTERPVKRVVPLPSRVASLPTASPLVQRKLSAGVSATTAHSADSAAVKGGVPEVLSLDSDESAEDIAGETALAEVAADAVAAAAAVQERSIPPPSPSTLAASTATTATGTDAAAGAAPTTAPGDEDEYFKSALVLVVVRLGLEALNPLYVPSLLSFFHVRLVVPGRAVADLCALTLCVCIL